jgi:hypothetical protein
MWACLSTLRENQRWTVLGADSSDGGAITLASSGKCLTVTSGTVANGHAVSLAACVGPTGNDRQRFTFEDSRLTGGKVRHSSGKCLSVSPDDEVEDGAKLHMWSCDESARDRLSQSLWLSDMGESIGASDLTQKRECIIIIRAATALVYLHVSLILVILIYRRDTYM